MPESLSEADRAALQTQLAAMQQLVASEQHDAAQTALTILIGRLDELQRGYPHSHEIAELRAAMFTNVAEVAERQGKWSRAESAWRDAVGPLLAIAQRQGALPIAQHRYAHAEFRLGEVLRRAQSLPAALHHLSKAVAAWGPLPPYRLWLARGHARLGEVNRLLRRSDEALQQLRRALELFGQSNNADEASESVYVQHQLARLLRELHQPAEALAQFEQAIERGRQLQIPPQQLAAIYIDQGEYFQALQLFDGAEEAIRQALRRCDVATQQLPLMNRLGVLYLDTGRSARAEATLKLAVSLEEKPGPRLAEALLTARLNRARAQCRLGQSPDTGAVHAALANLEAQYDGDGLDALRQQVEADDALPVSAQPPALTTPILSWRLGGPPALHRDHGEPPAALRESWQQAGDAVQRGELDDALATLTSALRIQPALPLQFDLIDLLRVQAREDVALRSLDAMLKDQPTYADGWYLRGLVLARLLDPAGGPAEPLDFARHEAAIDAFDEAILLRPDDAEYRLWKGRALFRLAHGLLGRNDLWPVEFRAQGKIETDAVIQRAAESFLRAARLEPQNPEAPFALGTLLTSLAPDRVEEAKAAFRRALMLRPDFDAARQALARMQSTE